MKIRKKYELNNIKEVSIKDLIDLSTEFNSLLCGSDIEGRLDLLRQENENLKEILSKIIERLHLDDRSIIQITGCNHTYELVYDEEDIEKY